MNKIIEKLKQYLSKAEFTDYIQMEKTLAQNILQLLKNDIELIKFFYKDDLVIKIDFIQMTNNKKFAIYFVVPHADPKRMISAKNWIDAIKRIERVRFNLCGNNA